MGAGVVSTARRAPDREAQKTSKGGWPGRSRSWATSGPTAGCIDTPPTPPDPPISLAAAPFGPSPSCRALSLLTYSPRLHLPAVSLLRSSESHNENPPSALRLRGGRMCAVGSGHYADQHVRMQVQQPLDLSPCFIGSLCPTEPSQLIEEMLFRPSRPSQPPQSSPAGELWQRRSAD